MQPEITVDLTPKGDFADHFDQQAQNDSDCIKMQDKMIEHKEADDKNSKAEGNSICHAAKLGQVAPKVQLLQSAHCACDIGHTGGKAPFIVVPCQNTHCAAANNLGLIWRKYAGFSGMVEIDADFGFIVVRHDHAHVTACGLCHDCVSLQR